MVARELKCEKKSEKKKKCKEGRVLKESEGTVKWRGREIYLSIG